MKTARKDPRHSQLALGGYLLMPIQRIPRYKMMLENLLECTPLADSPDQAEPLIAEALASMSNLATEMNERKRDNEGRQRLVRLEIAVLDCLEVPTDTSISAVLASPAFTLQIASRPTSSYCSARRSYGKPLRQAHSFSGLR